MPEESQEAFMLAKEKTIYCVCIITVYTGTVLL